MERALSAAASGMNAQELNMSVIADNLANVSTAGFKKSRAEFQDLLYNILRPTGSQSLAGQEVPTGLQVGQGVRASGTLRQFDVGDFKQTNNTLDVAIEGNGFLQLSRADGQTVYTRDGSLKVDSQGRLVNTDGLLLEPQIIVPRDMVELNIGHDGTVSARSHGQVQSTQLGQIMLAQFINPAGLEPLGHNIYAATTVSGEPYVSTPATNGTGGLSQGFLEMSNVKAIEEMIALIATQRAYEMGSRVISAADQMLGTTSNLR